MRSTEREIEQVDVALIELGERHRTPTDEAVERLAKSMGEIGLQCPILIRVVEDDEGIGNTILLVAGATRLAAAKKLGWQKIDTIEIEGDEILAEMVEIAENLHRLGLSKDQRDEHIRRYAELLRLREERETEENQVRQSVAPEIGYKKPPPQEKGIASKVAAETGLSTRTVQRVLNPKPPVQTQEPRSDPAASKPVPPPSAPLNDYEAINKQIQRIMSAWNSAGPEARERFLSLIDNPVMDSTVVMREFVDRETGEVIDGEGADQPSVPFAGTRP